MINLTSGQSIQLRNSARPALNSFGSSSNKNSSNFGASGVTVQNGIKTLIFDYNGFNPEHKNSIGDIISDEKFNLQNYGRKIGEIRIKGDVEMKGATCAGNITTEGNVDLDLVSRAGTIKADTVKLNGTTSGSVRANSVRLDSRSIAKDIIAKESVNLDNNSIVTGEIEADFVKIGKGCKVGTVKAEKVIASESAEIKNCINKQGKKIEPEIISEKKYQPDATTIARIKKNIKNQQRNLEIKLEKEKSKFAPLIKACYQKAENQQTKNLLDRILFDTRLEKNPKKDEATQQQEHQNTPRLKSMKDLIKQIYRGAGTSQKDSIPGLIRKLPDEGLQEAVINLFGNGFGDYAKAERIVLAQGTGALGLALDAKADLEQATKISEKLVFDK